MMRSTPQRPRRPNASVIVASAVCAALAFVLGRWSVRSSAIGPKTPGTDGQPAVHAPTRENAATPSTASWQQRWSALVSQRDQPTAESARTALMMELAAQNPEEAIRLAQAEPNWRQRGLLLRAALRGWSTRAPADAVAWMLAHMRAGERHDAVEQIAAGAVAKPTEAVQAIAQLCAADPAMAGDYGSLLITELARKGEFDRALEFARTANPAERNHWLSTAFFQWALYQPEQAAAAVARIEEPDARREAWQSMVSGWSSSDPASLVAFAERLPAGDDRQTALRDGLMQWVTADPVAAVSGMERLDGGDEFDAGAAAVATITELVAKNPQVAITWAKSIKDPERRSTILADVLRQWATRDPAAAKRFAETSTDLTPGDRNSIVAEIDNPAP